MMQNMMDCGFGGWLMGGVGLLFILLLFLAIAALAKYVFWGGRRARPGAP